MLQFILALLAAVRVFFRSRNDTALEVLALRQQIVLLEPETTTAAVESVGSAILDYPAPHLVPVGRGPGSSETGDRRRLAPGGISALLEVAIASTRWKPKATAEIRVLVRSLAEENPTWGAPRILENSGNWAALFPNEP